MVVAPKKGKTLDELLAHRIKSFMLFNRQRYPEVVGTKWTFKFHSEAKKRKWIEISMDAGNLFQWNADMVEFLLGLEAPDMICFQFEPTFDQLLEKFCGTVN